MPSFHQDGLFNALQNSVELDVRVVFARETTPDRLQMGWNEHNRSYSHRFLSAGFGLLEAVRIAWSERNRLHIISGIGAEPCFAVALCSLVCTRSRFLVYAEAFEPRRSRPGVRLLLRNVFGGWVGRRATGMLAISHFAEHFYTKLGFAPEYTYPFGYFQAGRNQVEGLARLPMSERTEVIFVGQLVKRKGVDILMEAIRPLFDRYPKLFLSVIGDGSEAESLQAAAVSMGIRDRVNFEGAMSSYKILPRIALTDVLVLPSRWDGWGMVVNEALTVGVPVIASNYCGAADLIQDGVNGYVFRSQDVEDLRRCLRRFLDSPHEHLAMRSAAARTGGALSAEAAAPYLIECLKHISGESNVRPKPPWAASALSGVSR